MIDNIKVNRIKQLNVLLKMIDSPNEGDEILFTLQGDNIKYRGFIKKKEQTQELVEYAIITKTFPAPKGVVETIEYKGKIFKTGENKKMSTTTR